MSAPIARLRRPVAALVWLLAIGVPAGMLALVIASPTPEQDAWAIPVYSGIVATWGLVGALLVTRRPANRVGWVMLAIGLGIGLALLCQLWAILSLARYEGTLPGTGAAAILGLLFFPAFYLVMLVPLLFPDGRLMSRRWAVVAAVLVLASAATLIGAVTRPGPLEGMKGLDNPLGMPGLGGLPQALIDIASIGALICGAAAILAPVLRYRRGTLVERRQLKWFGSAVGLAFSMFFAATVLPQPYGQWAFIVASASISLVPIAIGIAVLRYRLYEIDRIVSRTLSYAIVTALLAGVFVATNLALQAMLVNATGGSTLTTAASTLVVAALFQPIRRRVQRSIDRRFNRAGADAQRVVDALAATVRDEVDIARLRGSVVATAAEAVHPDGAALWLRGVAR